MEQETTAHDRKPPALSATPFWLAVWLGTALAGGVFGVVSVGLVGLPFGFVFAGIFGGPVLALAATLAWCFWLSPYRVVTAALAGAATGVVSSAALNGGGLVDFSLPLAGLLGGIGAGTGGALHWRRTKAVGTNVETEKNEPWQFTMGEMFSRMTVFAVLLAIVSSVVVAMKAVREEDHREMCEHHLRYLALTLGGYQASNGHLPPASLVDSDMTPTHSWRVLAMQRVYYDDDFDARIDFQKAWDDPANTPFLNSLGTMGRLQCPSVSNTSPRITHYVALTGPGTHWTEIGQLDEDAENRSVLVIEWPPSNIHWAEPRDVTPDEFLAWFESKDSPPRHTHRRGLQYIDAAGEVRTLPWSINRNELRRLLTPEPH